MNRFEYVTPENLEEAFSFLDREDAQVKGGGIDMLDLMKEGISAPHRLVNIRDLDELRMISPTENGGLSIGSAVTLAEIADHKEIRKKYQALAQAAESAATPQIRNSATVAGNLCQRPRCWYFRSEDFHCRRKGGDTCFAEEGENQYHAIFGNQDGCVIVHPSATAVALVTLEAKIKIKSARNEREIAVSKLFVAPGEDIMREHSLKPGEIISEIILPPASDGFSSYYFKQKEKQSFDWPIADVAVALNLKGSICQKARITLGSAAPVPWRLEKAEKALQGQKVSVSLAKSVASDALAKAEPMSLNAYKVTVFKTVLYRTICRAAGIDPFV